MLHHKLAHETIFLTPSLISAINDRGINFDQSAASIHRVKLLAAEIVNT